MSNTVVCCDLDDTLMLNGTDYDTATQIFGHVVHEHTGVNRDTAIETFQEIDRNNVDEYGLQIERFPESMVQAVEELVDNPQQVVLDLVNHVGYSVFKSEHEYATRGLMSGAEEFLTTMQNTDIPFHLITAGDPRVQQRKIDALELDEFFTDTHISPAGTKGEHIEMIAEQHEVPVENAFHVGNSVRSDVQAAIDVNANAVYIPNHQWQEVDNEDYYVSHENTLVYRSMNELNTDVPDVFHTERITTRG